MVPIANLGAFIVNDVACTFIYGSAFPKNKIFIGPEMGDWALLLEGARGQPLGEHKLLDKL